MKIELKLKRAGGSEIDMGDGTTYHFKPEDGRHESPHVADVADSKHMKRLLSIEGYEIFDPDSASEPEPEPIEPVPTVDGGNLMDGTNGDEDEDDAPDEAEMPLNEMTETDLRATYERELGKKPHHRAGMEKLIEDITAHRAAQE